MKFLAFLPFKLNLNFIQVSFLVVSLALAKSVLAQTELAELAGDGSVILQAPTGELLMNYNAGRQLTPASIVKIPLAHVALTTLGEDYRFETHFFQNTEGDLLVRGLGDPFLVSEEIAQITEYLAERGLKQVRRLVLDDPAFERELDLPLEENSNQPYGARNSALAVNFNTVSLAWTADGEIISGEEQTPLTSLARSLATQLPTTTAQRINIGHDPEAGLRQVQQLFQYFLAEFGITLIDDGFYSASLGSDWNLFYEHKSSRSLREILAGLLRYSNNFIANQIFLTLGAQKSGYPTSVEKSRTVLQEQLVDLYGDEFGTTAETLLMLEGSGLSRAQRTTTQGMLRILEVFTPYAELLPETNGALRKSGTLTGIYNFAGYIKGERGLYPFVILTDQAVNNRDEILTLLRQVI